MKHHFDYYWHWCSLKYISETLLFFRLWKLFHVTWRGIQMNRDCITLVKRGKCSRNQNLDSRSVRNWGLQFIYLFVFVSFLFFISLTSDFKGLCTWAKGERACLSVAQLIIQIYVQKKQDLINANNIYTFWFCYHYVFNQHLFWLIILKKIKSFLNFYTVTKINLFE